MKSRENNTFDLNATNIAKGFAIIFMLAHHLFGFSIGLSAEGNIGTICITFETLKNICLQFKICVGIFVFLTAFGITRSIRNTSPGCSGMDLGKSAVARYVKLEGNFLVVFVLALATSFLRESSLYDIYCTAGVKKGILYAVFDAFGLANYFATPSMNETWWYMSLAIFLVFITPVVFRAYQVLRGAILLPLAFLISFFGLNSTTFIQYFFCLVLGIWCAEERVFEKLGDIHIIQRLPRRMDHFLKFVICLCAVMLLLVVRFKAGYVYWIDGIAAVAVCWGGYELMLARIGIHKILQLLGRHSMNIFLIHTLLFEYYFTDFIYGFKYWILILTVLLAMSLAVSFGIEWLKKALRLNLLETWFAKKMYAALR